MTYLPAGRERSELTQDLRRVGFELEFAGLDLDTVAGCLAETLSGDIRPGTRAECTVKTGTLGTFRVELDWQLAKVMAEERLAALREEKGEEHPNDPLMEFVTSAASQVVPMEVVCPPIAVSKIDKLNPMVAALRDAGAVGTRGSPIYAFGVHINPELPDLNAATIAGYLKAFCIAQDWLVEKHRVDLARRITPYINLYPKNYVRTVVNYPRGTSLEQLLDDYLRHNPTRNRALDMTPLFKHLDEDRIVRELDDDRINARPTFHYRLPNCSIEEPDWNLMQSWSVWCVIEHLAADSEKLESLAETWRDQDGDLISLEKPAWHKTLEKIHQDLLSA